MIPQMEYVSRHPEKYSESEMYELDRLAIRRMMRPGHITTEGYGMENLPSEGGYIMCPNHQGKYDALGIMYTHDKRIDRKDARQSIKIIREMADEAKTGRKFIIFPEGGYSHNGNKTTSFKAGAFKSAVWAKVPIVPVVLIDSYKVFELHTLKPIKTFVYYLKPLYYNDYKSMTTVEIARLVQDKIQNVLNMYANGTLTENPKLL